MYFLKCYVFKREMKLFMVVKDAYLFLDSLGIGSLMAEHKAIYSLMFSDIKQQQNIDGC